MNKIIVLLSMITLLCSQKDIDTQWSFNLRERANLKVFNDALNTYNELRTRIGFKANLPENISAFIQLQDSRVYGSEPNTLGSLANTDLHQGYVLVDKLFDSDFSLKFGRMEMAYANQRIVGTVGWHNVGRSFDGQVVAYKTDNFKIDLFNHQVVETNRFNDDSLDVSFSGTHMNIDIIDGFKSEVYFYSLKNKHSDNSLNTSGFYLNGKLTDELSLETQFAVQSGSASKTADYSGLYYYGKVNFRVSEDISLAAAYESLSGDDGKDADKVKTFRPFFGTNHKFNGFMDKFFVGADNFNKNGLNDITLSAKMSDLTVDFHIFSNAEDIIDPTDATKKLDNALGQEIDIQYSYSYSSNLKAVFGFAYFIYGDDYKNTSDTSDYYNYTMLIFNF